MTRSCVNTFVTSYRSYDSDFVLTGDGERSRVRSVSLAREPPRQLQAAPAVRTACPRPGGTFFFFFRALSRRVSTVARGFSCFRRIPRARTCTVRIATTTTTRALFCSRASAVRRYARRGRKTATGHDRRRLRCRKTHTRRVRVNKKKRQILKRKE